MTLGWVRLTPTEYDGSPFAGVPEPVVVPDPPQPVDVPVVVPEVIVVMGLTGALHPVRRAVTQPHSTRLLKSACFTVNPPSSPAIERLPRGLNGFRATRVGIRLLS